MQRVAVLGGGISGLSLAHYLTKYLPNLHVTVFESSGSYGGWIKSANYVPGSSDFSLGPQTDNSFLFEKGPRGLRPSGRGQYALSLISELGLEDELIVADPNAQIRFILLNGKLMSLPKSAFDAFTKDPMRRFMPQIMTEWAKRAPRNFPEDECVYDFMARRFSPEFVETLINPMLAGIYSGDPRKLSIKSIFPKMHAAERNYGSMTVGLILSALRNKKSNEEDPHVPEALVTKTRGAPLISFQNGMQTLPDTLLSHLKQKGDSRITFAEKAAVQVQGDQGNEIVTECGKSHVFDRVLSTIPAHALSQVLPDSSKFSEARRGLDEIRFSSLAVLNFGYDHGEGLVIPAEKRGFGYLVPAKETNEKILGVVFDSLTFPTQNNPKRKIDAETRLTVMIGGDRYPDRVKDNSDEKLIDMAKDALHRHVGGAKILDPQAVVVHRNMKAIAQYDVGHSARVQLIEQEIRKNAPKLTAFGSSFHGVAVNDCIATSHEMAKKFVAGTL